MVRQFYRRGRPLRQPPPAWRAPRAAKGLEPMAPVLGADRSARLVEQVLTIGRATMRW